MSDLKQKIIDKIKVEGPISFETFMALALYDPEFGYYTRQSTVIGRAGDFYTSPHLHRIFGIMIGKQMSEMWTIMGKPEKFDIVEIGAGMGYLANDMLDCISTKELYGHIEYTIVELNPAIREQQKKLLSRHASKMHWVSSLNETGEITGCIVTNELLDAFPVHLVVKRESLMEVFVDDALAEVEVPCSSAVAAYLEEFAIDLPEGYRTEINLRIKDWIWEVSRKLNRGFVLTIDYGYSTSEYYSDERHSGTLLCYHKHQLSENPYEHVGEQDITAHVNFSSLKKWGEEAGLRADGYCPQGTYLVSLGIDEEITELYGNPPDPKEMAGIKGLIFPEGLGVSHQVMVQSKGIDQVKLRGFTIRNHAGRL